jgi:hypothetical protein
MGSRARSQPTSATSRAQDRGRPTRRTVASSCSSSSTRPLLDARRRAGEQADPRSNPARVVNHDRGEAQRLGPDKRDGTWVGDEMAKREATACATSTNGDLEHVILEPVRDRAQSPPRRAMLTGGSLADDLDRHRGCAVSGPVRAAIESLEVGGPLVALQILRCRAHAHSLVSILRDKSRVQ